MKTEFSSLDKSVVVHVDGNAVKVPAKPTCSYAPQLNRVSVHYLSSADNVSLSIKPSVIAQEARQERLSKRLRLGFPPVSMSTKG